MYWVLTLDVRETPVVTLKSSSDQRQPSGIFVIASNQSGQTNLEWINDGQAQSINSVRT